MFDTWPQLSRVLLSQFQAQPQIGASWSASDQLCMQILFLLTILQSLYGFNTSFYPCWWLEAAESFSRCFVPGVWKSLGGTRIGWVSWQHLRGALINNHFSSDVRPPGHSVPTEWASSRLVSTWPGKNMKRRNKRHIYYKALSCFSSFSLFFKTFHLFIGFIYIRVIYFLLSFHMMFFFLVVV